MRQYSRKKNSGSSFISIYNGNNKNYNEEKDTEENWVYKIDIEPEERDENCRGFLNLNCDKVYYFYLKGSISIDGYKFDINKNDFWDLLNSGTNYYNNNEGGGIAFKSDVNAISSFYFSILSNDNIKVLSSYSFTPKYQCNITPVKALYSINKIVNLLYEPIDSRYKNIEDKNCI